MDYYIIYLVLSNCSEILVDIVKLLFSSILTILSFGKVTFKNVTTSELKTLDPYRVCYGSMWINGPVFKKWYIGYYNSAHSEHTIAFFTKPPNINISSNVITDENTYNRYIIDTNTYVKGGGLIQILTSNELEEPYDWQDELINKINLSSNSVTVLLTGESGVGKSSFVEYLAKSYLDECNVAIHDLNPFGNNTACTTFDWINTYKTGGAFFKAGVLIILIDEIDYILQKLFSSEIQQQNKFSSEFTIGGGKYQWNRFFDNLTKPLNDFKVITILTTNKSKDDIVKNILNNDTSVLNNYRIHIEYNVKVKVTKME